MVSVGKNKVLGVRMSTRTQRSEQTPCTDSQLAGQTSESKVLWMLLKKNRVRGVGRGVEGWGRWGVVVSGLMVMTVNIVFPSHSLTCWFSSALFFNFPLKCHSLSASWSMKAPFKWWWHSHTLLRYSDSNAGDSPLMKDVFAYRTDMSRVMR